jgi:hypothetical protein
MRQLCSSTDLRELTDLVKRLVRIGIPCAVCKDGGGSQVSVWIQQDGDFPLALKMYVERKAPRPVPAWAHLIEVPVPAVENSAVPAGGDGAAAASDGKDAPSVVLVESRGPTRTGSVGRMEEAGGREPRQGRRRGETGCWRSQPERF